MRYYPIFLDIQNRRCLVIGGGAVGSRKVATLLACGAVVTVVSLEADKPLLDLAARDIILLHQRAYQPADVDGMFLVIGATSDDQLNGRIKSDTEKAGILCNIVDRPDDCNFILPSIVSRGDLTIAISTSGKSPAFAKKLRKDLKSQFGPEYATFLQLMGVIRTQLLSRGHQPAVHKKIFEQLIAGNLLELVKKKRTKAIDSLLFEVLGPGFEYELLMKLTT